MNCADKIIRDKGVANVQIVLQTSKQKKMGKIMNCAGNSDMLIANLNAVWYKTVSEVTADRNFMKNCYFSYYLVHSENGQINTYQINECGL